MTQTASLSTAAEKKIIVCLHLELYHLKEKPALQLRESNVFFNMKMLRQRLWYFMSGTVDLSISLATSNTAS